MQAEEGTDWLLELLTELQLQQYFLRIRDELNVTRLSHFEYVKNEDLEKIGMGRPGAYIHPRPPPIPPGQLCSIFWGTQKTMWSMGLGRTPTSCWVSDSHCVSVSCRPAAAVGGSEAKESHVQAEILDEQGRDGRVAGVSGKLRQAGGVRPLPMLFPSAHGFLGRFLAQNGPTVLALGKFIPLTLFASLPGNLFAASEPQSLGISPRPALGAAVPTGPLPAPVPRNEGAQPCACRLGAYRGPAPGDAHVCPLMPFHPKLVLLPPWRPPAPCAPQHLAPPDQSACRLGTGSRLLPGVTHLGWDWDRDGLLIEGYSALHWAQKCHLPPRLHAGLSPHAPLMVPGCQGWDGPHPVDYIIGPS